MSHTPEEIYESFSGWRWDSLDPLLQAIKRAEIESIKKDVRDGKYFLQLPLRREIRTGRIEISRGPMG